MLHSQQPKLSIWKARRRSGMTIIMPTAGACWENGDMSAYADLPDLVADDGYVLHVMPELDLKIALSSERSGEYVRRLRPFNAVDCSPFWKKNLCGLKVIPCLESIANGPENGKLPCSFIMTR